MKKDEYRIGNLAAAIGKPTDLSTIELKLLIESPQIMAFNHSSRKKKLIADEKDACFTDMNKLIKRTVYIPNDYKRI